MENAERQKHNENRNKIWGEKTKYLYTAKIMTAKNRSKSTSEIKLYKLFCIQNSTKQNYSLKS